MHEYEFGMKSSLMTAGLSTSSPKSAGKYDAVVVVMQVHIIPAVTRRRATRCAIFIMIARSGGLHAGTGSIVVRISHDYIWACTHKASNNATFQHVLWLVT